MSEAHTRRQSPGRPRSPPELIGEWAAFAALRDGHRWTSYDAVIVLAFCSAWQRSRGAIAGVIRSQPEHPEGLSMSLEVRRPVVRLRLQPRPRRA